MNLWEISYNCFGLPATRLGARLIAPFNRKVALGLAGRRKTFPEIENYCARFPEKRAPEKGILFHATSVGEYLQALPLLEELKAMDQGRPLYLSFFSPSVEKQARSCRFVDIAFYLPEDTRANMQKLIERLAPALVVVSKFDIWPNLIAAASEKGIPLAVTAATLSPDSGRLKGPAAAFHKSFYDKLSLVCAISAGDAANYARLGVKEENCLVTGDTRFDQTFRRASKVSPDDPLVLPFAGWKDTVRLACGSIWPADEEHLLPALSGLAHKYDNFRFILVPHEPSRKHIDSLSHFLARQGLSCELYSSLSGPAESGREGFREVGGETRAVIVDRMGVLAAVYRASDLVYVGGSFSTGVHNVMEPACFGIPVFFGPRHLNSYEARLMAERGGAFPVSESRECYEKISCLIEDQEKRRQAGEKAREVVVGNLGATGRTIAALAARFPRVIGKIREEGDRK